jgi:dCMP deaminase
MRRNFHAVMLDIASIMSRQALCQKRQVGCVLVDRQRRVLAMGYNGRPRGMPNCIGTTQCAGGCEGLHAEINAIMTTDADKIHACYVTTAPCWHCTKALAATQCREIWFADAGTEEPRAVNFWRGISLLHCWTHYENLMP